MIALLLKEFDGLRAYLYAVLAMLLFVLVDHALPPMAGWARTQVLDHGIEDWAFMAGLLAFSLGHTLVAVEYTEGHIEFLDGLPIRRWQVFVSKVLAVAVPLFVLVVGTLLIKGLVLWGLGTPGALPALSSVMVLGLRLTLVVGTFASLGMLASWMGGLGWGMVFLFIFGLMTLSVMMPSLNPYVLLDGMLDMDWSGGRPVMLWGPVVVWTAVSVVSVAVSGLLFLGPGRWLVKAGSWSGAFVRVGGLGCGTLLFLAVVLIAAVDLIVIQASALLASTERVDTEHFRFLYPTDERQVAQAIVAEADAIHDRLAEQMGNTDPLWLEVEMLGAGTAHAGRFLGGKIRMSLSGDARDTFVHELAHAHAFAISGWAVQHQFEHVRFFEEGLATYYEQLNTGVVADHRWAAAVWATDQARFDLLIEDDLRGETHDSDQAYALGEQFVIALVEVEGPDAVSCALHALGDIGDADVSGYSLWVEVMGRCDYDLDAVVVRYDDNLEALAQDLPPLPDLSAQVKTNARRINVTDAADTSLQLLCRFRDREDSERYQWETTEVDNSGSCRMPFALSGSSFQYQLGFRFDAAAWPVYLPWVTAEL